ncbi:MAG: response regulator [Chloroflexota bacterium]|nr:response regulator [Chloroflexota bacterium]
MNILVIEDDPFSRDVASTILEYHNIGVEAVTSAEEAMFLLGDNKYDALLIDLSLPQMDGWGLLRWVKTNPQTAMLPCFAVTAYFSSRVAQEAIESGFTAFFPKPLHPETFVQDLQKYL